MREDLIPEMAEFNAMKKSEQIDVLCAVHECEEKIRKIHRAQYCDRHWNPHPPRRFMSWWNKDGIETTERETARGWADIDAVRAFNCEDVREVYRQAKIVGEA